MQGVQYYQSLLVPILKKYAVRHAALFGSVVKGTMHEGSDIDLLVEPSPGFTLFKMLELEEEITALLKRKVDVVEYHALKASIKDEVLNTSVAIL